MDVTKSLDTLTLSDEGGKDEKVREYKEKLQHDEITAACYTHMVTARGENRFSIPVQHNCSVKFDFPDGCISENVKLAIEVTYTSIFNKHVGTPSSPIFWGPVIKVIQQPNTALFLKPFTVNLARPSVMENASTDGLKQHVFFGVNGQHWTNITEGLDMWVTETHINFKTSCFTGYTALENHHDNCSDNSGNDVTTASRQIKHLDHLANENIVSVLITNGHSSRSLFFDCWPQSAEEIIELRQRALTKDLPLIIEKLLLPKEENVILRMGENLHIDDKYIDDDTYTFSNPATINENHQEFVVVHLSKDNTSGQLYLFVKPIGCEIEDGDTPKRRISLELQDIYSKFSIQTICGHQYQSETPSTQQPNNEPSISLKPARVDIADLTLLKISRQITNEPDLYELGLQLDLEDIEIGEIRSTITNLQMAVYNCLKAWKANTIMSVEARKAKLVEVLLEMKREDIVQKLNYTLANGVLPECSENLTEISDTD